jgi:ATP-dependent Clp protease ATP-binding subunit ClpC
MDPLPPNDLPFNESAERLLAEALRESDRLRHEYIASEHLVVALTHHPDGTALLSRLGVDLAEVRSLVERSVRPGRSLLARGQERPYTSKTKRALSFATASARARRARRIGIQDLLVGILRENVTIGAQALEQCGVTAERVLGLEASGGMS